MKKTNKKIERDKGRDMRQRIAELAKLTAKRSELMTTICSMSQQLAHCNAAIEQLTTKNRR